MPGMNTKRRKLDNLHTELNQAIAILDAIVRSMAEADNPTHESALYGLMRYLERISEEIDVNVTALLDGLQAVAPEVITL